jgi:biopolymer transport protein TolQ
MIHLISQSLFVKILSSADLFGILILITLLLASVISWQNIIFKIISFKKLSQSIEIIKSKLLLNTAFNISEIPSEKMKYIINKIYDLPKDIAEAKLKQIINWEKSNLCNYIESKLVILATIGSVSTFIGLLGTVYGIMNSFSAIAASKSTNLSVVAPGISEALFATALGLVVAIPALIFYNYFSNPSAILIHEADIILQDIENSITLKNRP